MQCYLHQVSIHAPREGCDTRRKTRQRRARRFNSRTPGGVRPFHRIYDGKHLLFQFTHPGRGATYMHSGGSTFPACFNSRTPGGVRLFFELRQSKLWIVSIHAPREGCDNCGYPDFGDIPVSIHAPREGCDSSKPAYIFPGTKFQFTHPGRGATSIDVKIMRHPSRFQFTHPGRGATLPPE